MRGPEFTRDTVAMCAYKLSQLCIRWIVFWYTRERLELNRAVVVVVVKSSMCLPSILTIPF